MRDLSENELEFSIPEPEADFGKKSQHRALGTIRAEGGALVRSLSRSSIFLFLLCQAFLSLSVRSVPSVPALSHCPSGAGWSGTNQPCAASSPHLCFPPDGLASCSSGSCIGQGSGDQTVSALMPLWGPTETLAPWWHFVSRNQPFLTASSVFPRNVCLPCV